MFNESPVPGAQCEQFCQLEEKNTEKQQFMTTFCLTGRKVRLPTFFGSVRYDFI
jgi:hypothetical protein